MERGFNEREIEGEENDDVIFRKKYEKMEKKYKCNASVMHMYVNGMWK